MCTACLWEQQWISLAEVKVQYEEFLRNGADWDHIAKHLDYEPKGFNLQAGEPWNVFELGNAMHMVVF